MLALVASLVPWSLMLGSPVVLFHRCCGSVPLFEAQRERVRTNTSRSQSLYIQVYVTPTVMVATPTIATIAALAPSDVALGTN